MCAKGMPLELCSVRVTFVLLLPVPKIVEYLNSAGVSPFARWREKLDNVTRARITVAIFRLEAGNFSAAKGVGGIHELRLISLWHEYKRTKATRRSDGADKEV